MTTSFPLYTLSSMTLTEQKSLIIVLTIVVAFFAVLLILGIRKTYKLKKENERLNSISALQSEEEKKYKDFTEGHLYDNK